MLVAAAAAVLLPPPCPRTSPRLRPHAREPLRFVWCPDDDLRVPALDAGVAMCVAAECGFAMAQPSILMDAIGAGSIEIVKQVHGSRARRTNYVECQSPMFSRAARDIVLPRLDMLEPESGFGLDTFWSVFCERAGLTLGVVDLVATAHTKPNAVRPDWSVARDSYFVRMDINPWNEAQRVCDRAGVPRLRAEDRRVSRQWRADAADLTRYRDRVLMEAHRLPRGVAAPARSAAAASGGGAAAPGAPASGAPTASSGAVPDATDDIEEGEVAAPPAKRARQA